MELQIPYCVAPKYRRQIGYKQISVDIGQIIRALCARKGIEILEAAAMPDQIHLYVKIPPKYSVSEVMGYLKGKSRPRQGAARNSVAIGELFSCALRRDCPTPL